MNKYIYIIIFLLFSSHGLLSQKQGNIWYFGNGAGLDFNSGSPVPLFDGKLVTEEGCAAISDEDGRLLFYTDGITIWNRRHEPMPSGNGLLGHSSSTQSGVIVPKPGDPYFYYVFTVSDKSREDGFRYSLVDMRLDGGLGDVTAKNTMLCDSTAEKITAVVHENGFYIWVLMHEWNNDLFRAYLITPSGILGVENNNGQYPVISKTGSVHFGNVYRKIGYMKASPDGSKIALAKYGEATVELFTFNNRTGKVGSILSLSGERYANAYGIEFSNDGHNLFVSCMSRPSRILVYDVSSVDSAEIVNSESILSSVDLDYYYGAMQIASDKKIYSVYYDKPYVHVIENPTEKDHKKIRITGNKVNLGDRKAMWGLPTFIQSYFSFRIRILSNMPLCQGDTLHMKTGHADEAIYSWTGPNGFYSTKSEILIPNAHDSISGMYRLTTTINDIEYRDSVVITVNPKPKVTLGKDLIICLNDEAMVSPVIKGGSGAYDVSWSPSEGILSKSGDTVILSPWSTTDYIITVNDLNGCVAYDTISVIVNNPPVVKAGKDKAFCKGSFAVIGDTIITESGIETVLWIDSDGVPAGNTPRISVSPDKSTAYYIYAMDVNGCIGRDTVKISVNPVPEIELGDDILICDNQGQQIGAKANSGTPPYSYLWSPVEGLSSGNTAQSFAMPEKSVKYFLRATDSKGCTAVDSITVFVDSVLKSRVYIDCNMNSTPINKTIKVPLRIEAPVYFEKAGVTGFDAIIRFNSTMLKPMNFPYEFIKLEDGLLYIRIRGILDSTVFYREILHEMEFFTAYGNSTYTDIEIVGFSWEYSKCKPITTTDDGCIDIYNICIDFTIEFNDLGALYFGNIYPNPAAEEINIKMNNKHETFAIIKLYDLQGRLVKESPIKYYPIGSNLLSMPAGDIAGGIYTVRIDTGYGSYIGNVSVTK